MRENKTPAQVSNLLELMKSKSSMKELYTSENVERLIEYLDSFGHHLARSAGLKTSQIRKFLDAVKRIQTELRNRRELPVRQRIVRLKPALVYATARQKRHLQDFSIVVNRAIDMVEDDKDFNYFVEFVEGIVAYHKFHGGRD